MYQCTIETIPEAIQSEQYQEKFKKSHQTLYEQYKKKLRMKATLSNKAQREQGNIVEQICGQNAARITIKVAYSNCKRQHKNRLKLINNTEQENIVIMHLFQWYSSRLYHVTSVFSNLCKDTQYACKDDN
eukprot:310295_1